jgi:hypothetical protein
MVVLSKDGNYIITKQHQVINSQSGDVYIGYAVTAGTIDPSATTLTYINHGQLVESVVVDTLTVASGAEIVMADATSSIDMNGGRITNLPTPTDGQTGDAANVEYVQTYVTEQEEDSIVKTPADLVLDTTTFAASVTGGAVWNPSTSSFTCSLNGSQTIQSIVMTVGIRLLLRAQTSGEQNGIYTVTQAGSVSNQLIITRSDDADTVAKLPLYTTIMIRNGTYPGRTYRLDTVIVTMNVTSQTWTNVGTGSDTDVTAGNGIEVTGDNIVSTRLASSIPGLAYDGSGALKVEGPVLLTTGYLRLNTNIEANFGSMAQPAAIYHDGTKLQIVTRTSGDGIRLGVSGSTATVQLGDFMYVNPSTSIISYFDNTTAVQFAESFRLSGTSTSTTFVTMTFDGTSFLSDVQTYNVAANSCIIVHVNILGKMTTTIDAGQTYTATMTFMARRTSVANVQFPRNGVNQTSSVVANLLKLNADELTAGTWLAPRVAPVNPATSPATGAVQIQVASPSASTTVWTATCYVSILTAT